MDSSKDLTISVTHVKRSANSEADILASEGVTHSSLSIVHSDFIKLKDWLVFSLFSGGFW